MAALARRIFATLLTTTLLLGTLTPAAIAAGGAGDLLSMMNAARSANGLAPVSMHSDLTDDALAWSQHLMAQGSLSHNPNLASVTNGWSRLGENVGVGATIASLHDAFMASSSHRGNVLGDYDYVGIAVVEENPTKLWVTVVFMKAIQQDEAADQPAVEPADGPADGAGDEPAVEPAVGPADGPVVEPVPYADEQPTATSQQPVAAATSTQPRFFVASSPTAPAATAYARTGVQPLFD